MWSPLPILVLVLTEIAVAHKLKGCFSEAELCARADKLVRRSIRNAEVMVSGASATSCADFQRQVFSPNLMHRSLSPWTISEQHDSRLIPSTYKVATCLCEGCIINGTENTDYNSVPVPQTMMFLKKVKCPSDPDKYSLRVEYKEIPFACTCAVPRQ